MLGHGEHSRRIHTGTGELSRRNRTRIGENLPEGSALTGVGASTGRNHTVAEGEGQGTFQKEPHRGVSPSGSCTAAGRSGQGL